MAFFNLLPERIFFFFSIACSCFLTVWPALFTHYFFLDFFVQFRSRCNRLGRESLILPPFVGNGGGTNGPHTQDCTVFTERLLLACFLCCECRPPPLFLGAVGSLTAAHSSTPSPICLVYPPGVSPERQGATIVFMIPQEIPSLAVFLFPLSPSSSSIVIKNALSFASLYFSFE